VASQEVAAAQQRVELARLQVLTTARIYFFDVLAAERSVALARQLRELADEAVRVSELRLKALDIPRVSLLQSQVERESAALLEQQATERYDAAWRRLATVLGMNVDEPLALDDTLLQPLPELDWDAVRSRVLAESPELAELRFAVSRARWAVERASAGRVPNVDVEAGVALDHATEDTIANVRVSMPLPVFDRNQGAIAQACGELAAAQAALQQRELALEQRLAAALRDYTTARQRAIKYSESVLPIARESLDMTSAGYREGELDYLAVLSVQQTYAEKNLAYLQDLETAWKKWAEIDGLLVGPLPGQSE
jgi:cobalt-zinc-cadmium efflux system outer membrane protein